MDVLSNGPVTRRFCGNSGHILTTEMNLSSSKLWIQIMELFDKNGPYLKIEVCSIAFLCLNFLRIVAVLLVIPLWVILGLCSVGLLWPPQIRQKLMKQNRTRNKSAAIVKSEQHKSDMRKLKVSMSSFRDEISISFSTQKEDVIEIKTEMISLTKTVMHELKDVREILETLIELQDAKT